MDACSSTTTPQAAAHNNKTPHHAPGPPGLWEADMMRPPYMLRRRMSADMAGVAMMAFWPTTTCVTGR